MRARITSGEVVVCTKCNKTQAPQYQKTDEAPIRGGTPITTLILPPIQPTSADNRDTEEKEVETKTEQEDVENEEQIENEETFEPFFV